MASNVAYPAISIRADGLLKALIIDVLVFLIFKSNLLFVVEEKVDYFFWHFAVTSVDGWKSFEDA